MVRRTRPGISRFRVRANARPGMTALRTSLRRRGPRPPHKPRRVAKTLDHDGGQVLGLAGHAAAGTHGVAVLMLKMRWGLALLQRAGAVHHQFAEMHDAEIGGSEMLAA